MNSAHAIKLYPTEKQKVFFRKSCGVARFSYNWALVEWQKQYKQGVKPTAYSLIKLINSIKRDEYKWMLEVGKCAPQYAIHNLEVAFKKFFKKQSQYPKFKKRSNKDSFVAVENNLQYKQLNHKIWIPRIGWVKCAENLRYNNCKPLSVTVKRKADIWFAVVNVEIQSNEAPAISENQAVVGVDLGIKSLAVCSNGLTFENPKALQRHLKSVKRQQRSLCRKVKGSKNRKKQITRLSRLHYRVSCIRSNALHQATTRIVNSASVVVLEDLNVSGMVKNRKLSRAISDVGLYEFRRQIEYKAKWQNKEVIIADRFFSSSKICSGCGAKKSELGLSERIYHCEHCGLSIDRDVNAAKNLANYGATAKSAGRKACGEGSSLVAAMQPDSPSVKQEVNQLVNTKTL